MWSQQTGCGLARLTSLSVSNMLKTEKTAWKIEMLTVRSTKLLRNSAKYIHVFKNVLNRPFSQLTFWLVIEIKVDTNIMNDVSFLFNRASVTDSLFYFSFLSLNFWSQLLAIVKTDLSPGCEMYSRLWKSWKNMSVLLRTSVGACDTTRSVAVIWSKHPNPH